MVSSSVSLSVSLALQALQEQCDHLTSLEAQVIEQRAIRNDLIKDARDSGLSYRTLMRLTGLSRDRLFTIVNSPSTPSPEK